MYQQIEQVVLMLNAVYYDEHDLPFHLDDEMMRFPEKELKLVVIKRQQYQLMLVEVVVNQVLRSNLKKQIRYKNLKNMIRSYSFICSLSLNMFLCLPIKTKSMTDKSIKLFNTLSTFVHMSFNKG